MKKKVLSCLLLTSILVTSLCGCSSKVSTSTESSSKKASSSSSGTVSLTLYCEEDTFDLTNQLLDSFQKENSGTKFEFNLVKHSDAGMKNDVLRDVNADFDIFTFPDDQFDSLNAAGVLSEVPNSDEVKNRNVEGASECASYNGKMYAYPYTADNGYFLYYDKSYYTDEDVKTLDGVLSVANANGKNFSMQLDSGWYMYSFFGQVGLDFGVNEDGLTNHCDWNSEKGFGVVKALKSVIDNPAYKNYNGEAMVNGFTDGSVIAGVSGTWDASNLKKILGDNMGAVKMPTYTYNGQQVQMATFTGYKMMGVNNYSKNKEWAHKVADYLTNETSSLTRLTELSVGPSNIKASESDELQKQPAILAILDEAQFGVVQRVGNSYWGACTDFYNSLKAKSYSDAELQELLDTLVTEITKSVGN